MALLRLDSTTLAPLMIDRNSEKANQAFDSGVLVPVEHMYRVEKYILAYRSLD